MCAEKLVELCWGDEDQVVPTGTLLKATQHASPGDKQTNTVPQNAC